MRTPNPTLWRALKPFSLAASVALLTLLSTSLLASEAIEKGQQYVMATHSFNVFIGPTRSRNPGVEPTPGPLAALAAERGKEGHEALAVQMIGGSTPMQHWQQGDGDDSKNIAKVALRKGSVDVFTMSPNAVMPEPAIDLFGDLMIETNPQGRILVQNSWAAWDGNGTTVRSEDGTRPERPTFTNEDHNKADLATIDGWLESLKMSGGYMERLRTQLEGINERAGRQMTYVVPSSVAVYNLRKEIIKGNVPGIEVQSDIFRDGLGHVTQPGVNLVTYAWYATMYRESPIGLTALIDPEDPTSAARERLLQKLAWNAVVAEPMSGVKGEPVDLREG
ncbi:MAG: hypothetical protein WDZ30_08770 [Cellvibrionaceae bacterium]